MKIYNFYKEHYKKFLSDNFIELFRKYLDIFLKYEKTRLYTK